MSSRAAGSVLLRHLGPRLFGPAAAAPSVAAPRMPLLALAAAGGRGHGAVWTRLFSISASEARADVAEVYASKERGDDPSKVQSPISASEAMSDVAEVYASKMNYVNIVAVKAAMAEEAAKKAKLQAASKEEAAAVGAAKEKFSKDK